MLFVTTSLSFLIATCTLNEDFLAFIFNMHQEFIVSHFIPSAVGLTIKWTRVYLKLGAVVSFHVL